MDDRDASHPKDESGDGKHDYEEISPGVSIEGGVHEMTFSSSRRNEYEAIMMPPLTLNRELSYLQSEGDCARRNKEQKYEANPSIISGNKSMNATERNTPPPKIY